MGENRGAVYLGPGEVEVQDIDYPKQGGGQEVRAQPARVDSGLGSRSGRLSASPSAR